MAKHRAVFIGIDPCDPFAKRLRPCTRAVLDADFRCTFKVVRLIFDWYVNQNLGMQRIARRLNEEGYRSSTGKHWCIASVKWVLCHPAYGNEAKPYTYPPIIDKATWQAAQKKRRRARSVRRDPKGWLLQGMIGCGLCGRMLACRQKNAKAKRKYVCWGRDAAQHVDGSDRCALAKVDAQWLENEVWAKFARAASESGVLRKSVAEAVSQLENRKGEMGAGAQGLTEQLSRVENRIARLVQGLAEADSALAENDLAKFRESLERLTKEKASLQARRANLNPEAQVEVERLEGYIAYINDLLSRGGPVVDPDGIRILAYGDDGGFHDPDILLETLDTDSLVEGVIKPVKPGSRTRHRVAKNGQTVISAEMPVDLWAFEHPKEARIRSMRDMLQRFNVRVLAHPDKFEIQGMIPTQLLQMPVGAGVKWGREFKTA